MGVDEVSVDLFSIDDFGQRLEARALQVRAALAALTDAQAPALGHFQDAELTAGRYAALREEQVRRLNRLVDALEAARIVTARILETYRSGERHNESTMRASGDRSSRA